MKMIGSKSERFKNNFGSPTLTRSQRLKASPHQSRQNEEAAVRFQQLMNGSRGQDLMGPERHVAQQEEGFFSSGSNFSQKMIWSVMAHSTHPSSPAQKLELSTEEEEIICRVVSGPLEGTVIAVKKRTDGVAFKLLTRSPMLHRALRVMQPHLQRRLMQEFRHEITVEMCDG